eukprot:CAMPEP_0183517464 /NCGR_PEP_ID=MMETSP0371-20130417/14884_1 /TAXON_ID=268820 /ORGANISM="Peridinium aciculiferum, Strain PAER-2" /LENGTH=200 /DNA_ID=CAMNT_0025715353 /DNA_START=220 /DNA_END=818 /DNA_ORIENTATION=+
MDAEGACGRHSAHQAEEPGASKQSRDEQVPSEARTAVALEPPGGGGPPAAHGQARGDAEHGQQDAKGLRPSDKRRQRCRIEPECRPRCTEVEDDQLRGHNAQQVCQAHRRQASHRIAALMALHGALRLSPATPPGALALREMLGPALRPQAAEEEGAAAHAARPQDPPTIVGAKVSPEGVHQRPTTGSTPTNLPQQRVPS